ncbi:hypothetical protein OROMI_012285 [Orobanche minor]
MATMSAHFVLNPKSHFLSLSHESLKPSQFNYFAPLPSPILPLSTTFRCGKTSFAVIRASCSNGSSVDVTTSGIRPWGRVEIDKLPSDVRKRAVDAVDSSGRRVTIGDVASKAGLKLNEAQKALQALAADTNGFLEVSEEGDVLYVFPTDYRKKLAAKSFRMKIEPMLEKGKEAAEYLVRVSFGTALIASIVLVYTTIIAIALSIRDSDDRDRRGKSHYRNFSGFSSYISPTDLFWFLDQRHVMCVKRTPQCAFDLSLDAPRYWDPYYYSRRRVRKDDGRMNFIESIFSFVFGDGDPNQGIAEERWKLVGQYITSSGGIVAAEELAPYLDLDSEEMDDDSYILPVLLLFDGQPEVDEKGNILYHFPSLQRTAAPQRSGREEYVGRNWSDWSGGVEKFFKEKKWELSKTSASERAMVIGLGGLNLFGVLILGSMLKAMTVSQSGLISFVSDLFPLFQIYAGSFFAIPLIRWFFIQNKNAKILKRNRAREQRARALESPDPSLRQKLLSARDMAQRTFIGKDRIIYSTERDLYEQDYEAREWDLRFNEIEKS